MGDEPNKLSAPKADRAVRFVTNLCAIAWAGALFGEVLPRGALKFLCILFGSHAALLALLTCLILWPAKRQSALFLLLLVTAPPSIYFAFVLKRVAQLRGWIA